MRQRRRYSLREVQELRAWAGVGYTDGVVPEPPNAGELKGRMQGRVCCGGLGGWGVRWGGDGGVGATTPNPALSYFARSA